MDDTGKPATFNRDDLLAIAAKRREDGWRCFRAFIVTMGDAAEASEALLKAVRDALGTAVDFLTGPRMAKLAPVEWPGDVCRIHVEEFAEGTDAPPGVGRFMLVCIARPAA